MRGSWIKVARKLIVVSCFCLCMLWTDNVSANSPAFSHYWGKIQGTWFQGPVQAVRFKNDQLVDLFVFRHIVGLKAEIRNKENIFTFAGHTLEVENGREAALLDGRVVLLSHQPVLKEGHLLVPFRQSLTLLGIPYEDQDGIVNVKMVTASWKKLCSTGIFADKRKNSIGYIGLLDNAKIVLASSPTTFGKSAGMHLLYEGKWESPDHWVVNKLRPLTDTSSSVYMEYLPNEHVMQNLFLDARPEVMVVESCSCAGSYNYATMFTVTEMGLTSIWHSQYSYDRIERSGKSWELVSYRKENLPDRSPGAVPYWEVRETWTGNEFSIIKETFHAPEKK